MYAHLCGSMQRHLGYDVFYKFYHCKILNYHSVGAELCNGFYFFFCKLKLIVLNKSIQSYVYLYAARMTVFNRIFKRRNVKIFSVLARVKALCTKIYGVGAASDCCRDMFR